MTNTENAEGLLKNCPSKIISPAGPRSAEQHTLREASRERNYIPTTARAWEHQETLFGPQDWSCRPLRNYSSSSRLQEAFHAAFDTSVTVSDVNAMVFISLPSGLLCYKLPGRDTCNEASEQELI